MHSGEQSLLQSDTAPGVEQRWLEMLSRLSTAERAREAFALSDDVRRSVWAAVARRFPDASHEELEWRFAEQVYGEEVAARIRRWRR
jgi:hypothetical protein